MRYKVAIFGASGYLGSSIASKLKKKYRVIGISRSKQRYLYSKRYDGRRILLNRFFRGVHTIIYSAGLSAKESKGDPLHAKYVNDLLAKTISKVAIRQKVNKVIYLSTAQVYSEKLEGIITEKSKVINKHPYATTHRDGEKNILRINKKKGKTKGIVLRLANIYGAPEKDGDCWNLFINQISRQAITEKKILIKSKTNQTRNFLSNFVFEKIIEKLIIKNNNKIKKNIFNVGGKEYKISEVVDVVIKCCKTNYKIGVDYPKNFQEDAVKLNYRVTNLRGIKIYIRDNISREIKKLLEYCKNHSL